MRQELNLTQTQKLSEKMIQSHPLSDQKIAEKM